MEKALLLKIINSQMVDYRKNKYDQAIFHNIRYLFDQYLSDNPCDTEVWLNYTMCMYRLAEDVDYAEECLKKILDYEQNNIFATMLLVYIGAHSAYLDDYLFRLLCNLKTENKEILSMIEFEKIWYYIGSEMYEKVLLESVKLYDKHVWNNVHLGWIYLEKGDIKKGQQFLKKGLDNVEFVYDGRPYDELSVEEYFNENIKGIHLSKPNYESILESFDQKSPWITGDFKAKNNNETTEN